MMSAPMTYLTENDVLRHLRRMEQRGLSFYPMTIDELTLVEQLCRRGLVRRDGASVRMAAER